MNHIYRSIWNDSTATYVAAAETSKSGGKKASSSTGSLQAGRWALRALAASLCLAYGTGASALPQGGVVAAGSANVTATPGNMTIVQGSQSAVLNWQSFGIGAGESVQFVQPNASAVALNRVVGTDPSAIFGKLSANGKVFLVNPNGILFGKGASVNVGGLVASTLGIKDSDFMAGRYKFSGNSTQAVSNLGSINAAGGYVAMLGAHVSNDGVIAARMGSVALAGGQAITLDVAGDGLLNVSVDQGAVNALVSNGGLIQADGGQVLMTAQAAGKLLKTVVNNTGVIRAQTLVNHNGSIKLLGDMQTGTVNAAGTLDASAPAGGNGGFIETSAANVKIADELKVTTSALAGQGRTGTWLIDPTDFTIAATGGNQTGAFYTNALKTTDVHIQTVATGGGLGNINVNDTISWSANELKLSAHNNININAPLRGSGTATLALRYGLSSVASGNLATYNVKAEVDLPSGNNFSTTLGSDGAATVYTVINSLGAAGSTTGTDLQGLRNAVTGNYVLGANIDASATSTWNSGLGFVPVGTAASPFSGQFDGLGHVITGLNSSTTTTAGMAGLFGSNTGSLRNIGLVAPVISANITGTIGNMGALAALNSGSISNAFTRGGTVTVVNNAAAGGLVGTNSGKISDSYNGSTVSVSGVFDYWLGGLVGNTTKTSTITNSYNTGEVVGKYTAGGLVGNNLGAISNSFNSGSVSGTTNTGGLASHNRNTGVITNSFNTGAVTSAALTGGLVGSNLTSAQIINSYSTGAVTSNKTTASGIGGLVGGNAGIVTNSYATGAVAGATIVGGVIGSSTGNSTVTNVYSSGAVTLVPGANGDVGGVIGRIASGTNPSISGGYYNTTANSGLQAVGNDLGSTPPVLLSGLTASQMRTASNFGSFSFTTTPGATGNSWVMVNTDGTLNSAGNATGATGPMLASEYSTNIYSAHQLQLMTMNLAGNYTLRQDINAAGTGTTGDVWNGATFVPVGSGGGRAFSGSLDGAGHVISGLVVNRPSADFAGLFGYATNGASVRNVGLEGGSITGKDYTGALVGANQGGTVSGNFSTVNVTGNSFVGGLVGNSTGTLSNNYASGAVTAIDGVGGLLGSNVGSLSNNYATGLVSGGTNTGGLLGYNFGSGSGNFWDTSTSGQAGSAIGTGLSTAQMKLLSTYTAPGWDLANTWIVYDGNTSPLLRAFMTPLQVTFAANASKTYDGTSSWTAPSYVFSNPNAVLSGSLNYGAAGSAVNAGTYAITAAGLYSGQHGYAISANSAALTIDPKVATLSGATVVTRDYDGTTAAVLSGGTLSGLIGADLSNISVSTGTFASKNAGTGITVTALATGSASGNYMITPAASLLGTITPKELTVSGLAGVSRQYDASNAVTLAGGTLSGMVGGETLTMGSSTGSYADANAGLNKAITVNSISIGNGSGLTSNYIVAAPTGVQGTVTAKTLTWNNLVASGKEYDGNASAVVTGGTLSGFVGSETLSSASIATFADQNVGSGKTVTLSTTLGNGNNGGLASNYTVSGGTTTANITPKALSVTGATAGNKEYDGNIAALISGGTLSGMVSGETLTLGALSGTFSDKNAGTGKAVTVTGGTLSNGSGGGLASNYTVGSVTGLSADITPKALTVTGVTVVSKTYDGGTKATISGGTLNGLVSGESLGLSGQSGVFNDKDAGSGKAVTISGATLSDGTGLASNYTVSNATGVTGNITPKALTVMGATASDKVYDGGTAATVSGGSLSGMVGSETLGLSSLTGVFGDKNVASGKAVTVTGGALSDGTGGGLASNYRVDPVTGLTASITPKALTVSGVMVGDKVYDGNTTATLTGGTLNGLVGGETLSMSGQAGVFADKDAGTGKLVTLTGTTLVDGSGLASNYSVTNPTGLTGSITPKALTVTGVAAANKVYDATTKATIIGGTLNGLVAGESLALSGMSGAFDDKNVGTGKAVTISGATLSDGLGLASNYTVSNPTNVTASIGQATISSVTNVVADTKTYDGGTSVTFGSATATFNGMVSGDSLAIGATKASFSDKNAGTGKGVTISFLTLGGTDAANYTLASNTATGTGTITPKALTITGVTAVDKVYDGTTMATLSGGSIGGLVGSETLGVTGLNASFDDKNAGTGKTVTATGSILVDGVNGGLASNYTLDNPTGLIANITPKALTVLGMTADSKVYDGTTSATLSGGSLSGLVTGDTLMLSGGTGVFADKNVGNGKAVMVSGVGIADGTGLASNYSVTTPTNVTGSITQKVLSVTGTLAADKTYDGALEATITGGSLLGLVGSETLTLSGQIGVFSDKNAGSGKAVTISGATLADAGSGATAGLASNYSVINATGVTADIAQKALTVTGITAGNKVYDGSTAASLNTAGASFNGIVLADQLTASASGVFADKNAATGKDVAISGIALGGADAGNYRLTGTTATAKADIAQKDLSVTGITAGNKVYDGSTAASLNTAGASFNGIVLADQLTASASGVFADKNAATGKDVAITGIALGGADAGNYHLTGTTATAKADIAQKDLTLTGQVVNNKVYDGNSIASLAGGSLIGLVNGETLGIGGQTATFYDKNAGTAKAVLVSGTTLLDTASGLASNYTVSNPSGLTASITPKALNIVGMTAASKVFDGTPTASLSGGTLTGMVGNETLILSGSKGMFDSASVGSDKVVTVSGTTLSDGSGLARNYSVGNPTGLTADITAATTAAEQPSAGSASASVGGGNSPLVDISNGRDVLNTLELASDGSGAPMLQTGTNVPFHLAALRFSITNNGIRLPPGVVPASKDGN